MVSFGAAGVNGNLSADDSGIQAGRQPQSFSQQEFYQHGIKTSFYISQSFSNNSICELKRDC